MIKASDMVLLGGVPCLDFTNTKNWNDNEKPHDAFTDYASFLAWGLQLELITPLHAEQLLHGMKGKEEALAFESMFEQHAKRFITYSMQSQTGGPSRPTNWISSIRRGTRR